MTRTRRTTVVAVAVAATLFATAASAATPPTYEVRWERGGMSAPYTLGAFDHPALGSGVFAAGYTGGVAAVTRGGVRWRFADGAQLAGAAFGDLTRDGIPDAVLGEYPATLTVVDGSSGEAAATRSFPAAPEGLAIADATGDGVNDLYVVTQGRGTTNTVSLLDGMDLDPAWTLDLGVDQQFVLASDAGDLDGDGAADLVFGTYANGPRVYAYGSDGSRRWDVDLGGTVSNVAIADGGRTVLASRTGASLASIDARTGAVRWTATAGGSFSRMQAADMDGDGTDDAVWAVYGPSGKSPLFQVLSVDGVTGLPHWVVPTGAPPKGLAVGDLDGDGRPDAAATTQDVSPNVQQPQNFVWAIHGQTGRVLWTHVLAGDQTTYLSDAALADVAGDTRPEVVVAPYFDVLLGLSASDGAERWSAELGSYVTDALPADLDGDGALETVEATGDFRVTARRAADGGVLWSRDLGAETLRLATLPAEGGHDVLATALSTLYRLRGSDGAVRWAAPLHGLGSAMAVVDHPGGAPSVAVGVRLRRTPRGFGNESLGGALELLDAATGRPRWAEETPGTPWDLTAADLSGDGATELIAGSPTAAQGITVYDGATLATLPVPLWQTATAGGVSGLAVSGGQVMSVQPSARVVAAQNGASGATTWTRTFDEAIRSIGFADVTEDGVLDPLLATETFASRVAAVDGRTGASVFDADAGIRFVTAARWDDVSGDARGDLVYASDGGTFGEGGIFAIDGETLNGAEPLRLWAYERINAVGLETASLGEPTPALLAYGPTTLPDSIAVIQTVPEQP